MHTFFLSTAFLAIITGMAARMGEGISTARKGTALQLAFEHLHDLSTRGVINVDEGSQEAAFRAMKNPVLVSNTPEIPPA